MNSQADFYIAQSAEYVGNDRWKWSCWIDADPVRLADIASVTWILHPTFTPQQVKVTTRDNGFRLDSGGWGTFTLRARLEMVNGVSRELRHALKLSYPETDAAPSFADDSAASQERAPDVAPSGPKVFLSYASEFEKVAQTVNKYMSDNGASVLLANQASPNQPLEAAVQKMIRESDAFVSIQSDDYAGHWVMLENKIAHAEGKPMLSMSVGNGDDMKSQVAQFVNNIAL